jgi:hypothetical protein
MPEDAPRPAQAAIRTALGAIFVSLELSSPGSSSSGVVSSRRGGFGPISPNWPGCHAAPGGAAKTDSDRRPQLGRRARSGTNARVHLAGPVLVAFSQAQCAPYWNPLLLRMACMSPVSG